VPTWVYEVEWIPGSGVVNMYNVINILQGDIRSVMKGDNLSGGGQLLYTTTRLSGKPTGQPMAALTERLRLAWSMRYRD